MYLIWAMDQTMRVELHGMLHKQTVVEAAQKLYETGIRAEISDW